MEFFVLILREVDCSLEVVSGEEFFAKDGRFGVVAGVVFDVCFFELRSMKGFLAIRFG